MAKHCHCPLSHPRGLDPKTSPPAQRNNSSRHSCPSLAGYSLRRPDLAADESSMTAVSSTRPGTSLPCANSPLEPDVLRLRVPWGSWPSSAGMDEVHDFFPGCHLQVNAGSGCDPIRHSPCCMLHVAGRMPADRTLCRELLPSAGPAVVAKLCFDLCKDQSPHFSEVHCGQTRGQDTHPATLCTYSTRSGWKGLDCRHTGPFEACQSFSNSMSQPWSAPSNACHQGLASLAEH